MLLAERALLLVLLLDPACCQALGCTALAAVLTFSSCDHITLVAVRMQQQQQGFTNKLGQLQRTLWRQMQCRL
jgi:hypothetical protein